MRIVLHGSFDPITKSEIEYAKSCKKDVYFSLKEEGILSYQKRKKLLLLAIKPYRHFHLLEKHTDSFVEMDQFLEDEKVVRTGHFYKSAYGTRTFLLEEGCYLEEIVEAMCSKHRAIHSYGVAQTCATIAKHIGYPSKKAYIAGMLHDVTKQFSKQQNEEILKRYDPDKLAYHPNVWHSYTAPIWLKENMLWKDQELLQAIYHHTIGDGQGILDKILYVADKIEPNRGYDTSKQMALACKDIHAANVLVLKESEAFRNKEVNDG